MIQLPLKRHRQDFMDINGVVVPLITETGIYGLFGQYRALSNFHMAPVVVDGREYKCSEAAYMAEKTDDPVEKEHLTTLGAIDAKKYGQTVTLKPNWDEIKIEAMYKVLFAKFEQNDQLCHLLADTFPKYLEETNWWNDKFWGVCGGEGLNMLGHTLMRVRQDLMRADTV